MLLHHFSLHSILFCLGRSAFHILHHQRPARFPVSVYKRRLLVCKICPIPDCPHPSALAVCVGFLQGEVHLQPQIADFPGPLQRGQLVVPPRLLLAVEMQDRPAGRHPLGRLVVVLAGRLRRTGGRGGDRPPPLLPLLLHQFPQSLCLIRWRQVLHVNSHCPPPLSVFPPALPAYPPRGAHRPKGRSP